MSKTGSERFLSAVQNGVSIRKIIEAFLRGGWKAAALEAAKRYWPYVLCAAIAIIMLPMIITSAILGPLSTCVFGLKCGASGGGMGTSGFVGVFDLFKYTSGALGVIGIILLMFVLPALLNIVISEFMRKKNIIKFGDMKLPE